MQVQRLGRALVFLSLTVGAPAFGAHVACSAAGVYPIHALAASGTVRVRGVVTAVFPGLGGYFIEAPRAAWDAKAATLEGVFVYTGRDSARPAAGANLLLVGRFQVFHGMPELVHAHLLARCGRAALPPAVVLRLPLSRRGGWHGLLGMRVRFAGSMFVSDLDDFLRYGEVLLAAGARLYAPTALTRPGPQALALARAQRARTLWLDDGNSRVRPRPPVLAGRRFDAAHPLRAGQALDALTGIAYHAFGRDLVEPTAFDLDRGTNPRPTPASLRLPAGPRVLSFNVENYFNRALAGPAFPTARGARTRAEWICQREKLTAALAALHPALAALQEIGNNGYGTRSAIASLVAALNRRTPGAPYASCVPRAHVSAATSSRPPSSTTRARSHPWGARRCLR